MSYKGKNSSMSEDAIRHACNRSEWEAFLVEVEKSIKLRLKELNLHELSQLSDEEQAILVENEVIKMNKQDSNIQGKRTLQVFSQTLHHCIDTALVDSIHKSSLRPGKMLVNDADKLMTLTSHQIIELIETSTINLKNSLKLFINRPLPISLRKYFWLKALHADPADGFLTPETSLQRLIPTLDIICTRRCYRVLESSFPEYSTSANVHLLKSIISEFYRQKNLSAPPEHDDVGVRQMDRCILLLIPLLVTLADNDSIFPSTIETVRGGSMDQYHGSRSIPSLTVEDKMRTALMQLSSGRFIADGKVDNRLIAVTSNSADRIMMMLASKDEDLARVIYQADDRTSSPSTFSSYLHDIICCGLSSSLSMECVCFIWDQGFLFGLDEMIRICIISIIIGAKDELMSMRSIAHVINILTAFAQQISLSRLQSLIKTHCMKEMKELFNLSEDYVAELALRPSYGSNDVASQQQIDDDILQSIYHQLSHDSSIPIDKR